MADYDLKVIAPDTGFTTGNFLFGADNQGAATPVPYSADGIKTFMSASPTLVTPVIGAATGTSLALSGALTALTFNGLTITTTTGTLTIPNGVVLTGPAASGTAMTLGNAETVSGVKTFTAAAPQIILGVNTTTLGSIKLFGSTSGDVTVKAAAVAGTATVFQLPPTNGSNTNVLQTDGTGVTSWVAAGGAGSLTVGTSAIGSGTAGRLLYEAAGNVLGEPTGVTSNGTGLIITANGALSSSTGPGLSATGTWITGGTATTTKPYVLIETTGATSTAWSTSGTGLGINAATGFAGNLVVAQLNGAARLLVNSAGGFTVGTPTTGPLLNMGIGEIFSITESSNKLVQMFGTAFSFAQQVIFGWNPNSSVSGANDLFLFRAAAATLQHGSTDSGGVPVAQNIQVQSVVAGTSNTAGANWTFRGSKGTGTGAGGQIILQTAPAGSTGTSQNALATGLTITAPAVNMQPSVVVGNQALATTATDGFLYIPTSAGTPTGVPTTFTGRVALIYDTTNFQFWIYDGAWKQPKTPAGAALVTWQ